VAVIMLWGLGCFSVNSSQQARLISMAPKLASASVALNSSAIYFGQGVGAFIGGLIISSEGTANLGFYGSVPMICGIAASLLAASMSGRRTAAA
jgi:predicted MFS family arabinose efflux permease